MEKVKEIKKKFKKKKAKMTEEDMDAMFNELKTVQVAVEEKINETILNNRVVVPQVILEQGGIGNDGQDREANNNYNKENNEFNLKDQVEFNNEGRVILRDMPKEELRNVRQYVGFLHNVIYKGGDMSPKMWQDYVVGVYKRAKNEKGKELRGLKSNVIVGVIVYCYLRSVNLSLPEILFVGKMNQAVQMYRDKANRSDITLEEFNKYKKMKFLRQSMDECYKQKTVWEFIAFMCNVHLELPSNVKKESQRIAMKIKLKGKLVSKETIAIGVVGAVCEENGIELKGSDFFMNEEDYKKIVKRIIKSEVGIMKVSTDKNVTVFRKTKGETGTSGGKEIWRYKFKKRKN